MWNKKINYLSLLILLGGALIFYHHYLLLIMMILMIIMPIVSYFLMKYIADRIKITVSIEKISVGKEIPVDVCFAVQNNTFIPIETVKINSIIKNTFYENEDKYSLIMTALPKKKNEVYMTVSGIYCGRLEVKINEYEIYDFLGMFKRNIKCFEKAEFYIMPSKKQEYEKFNLSPKGNSEEDELQLSKGDDVSQISQIRDYIPGDRLSNIHWKLSSKKEEMQVKEYSLPFSEDVILFVETYIDKENPLIFDEIIEVLFSIGNDLINQRRKFSVAWASVMNYEINYYEINNDDDLISVIKSIYYEKSLEYNGAGYELFDAINSEVKATLLYLLDGSDKKCQGEKIDVGSERVVLVCQ